MSMVLMTGCNRGLGLEFARQYSAEGWDVIATCRTPERADDLQRVAQDSKNVRIERLDIAEPSSVAAFVKSIADVSLDVVINNAGILSASVTGSWADNNDPSQSFGSLDPSGWQKVLYINTIAPVMLSQSLIHNLRQSQNPKIIMISSVAGSIANMTKTGHIAYRTSKTALNTAMKNMAFSLESQKVLVASLHPGWVQTEMGGKEADIDSKTSVSKMKSVIQNLTMTDTGKFFSYDGSELPW